MEVKKRERETERQRTLYIHTLSAEGIAPHTHTVHITSDITQEPERLREGERKRKNKISSSSVGSVESHRSLRLDSLLFQYTQTNIWFSKCNGRACVFLMPFMVLCVPSLWQVAISPSVVRRLAAVCLPSVFEGKWCDSSCRSFNSEKSKRVKVLSALRLPLFFFFFFLSFFLYYTVTAV